MVPGVGGGLGLGPFCPCVWLHPEPKGSATAGRAGVVPLCGGMGWAPHTYPWPPPSSPLCSPTSSRSPYITPPLVFCTPLSEISRSRLQVCNLGKTNKRRAARLYLSETQRLCFAGNFDHFECETTWKKKIEGKKLKSKFWKR